VFLSKTAWRLKAGDVLFESIEFDDMIFAEMMTTNCGSFVGQSSLPADQIFARALTVDDHPHNQRTYKTYTMTTPAKLIAVC